MRTTTPLRSFTFTLLLSISTLSFVGGAAGCLTTETRQRLDAQEKVVASLQAQIAAGVSAGDLPALEARLKEELERLSAVKTEAFHERIGTGADITGQVTEAAKPIAGWLFPPALIALNLIGGIAGFLSGKYGKKVPA